MIAPATLRPPSPATTLVVLLGASEYPRKPAWTNPVLGASAAAVRDYVTSPDGFGLPAAQVLDLFDSDVDQVRQLLAIEQFLATAGNAPRDLILYYIGHGGFENRDYYLGIRSTQDRREDITTIESRKLAKIVREGFRRKRLYVIMDACFAASALGDWQGDEAMAAVRNMEQHLPAQGTAFLAAASKHDVTLAPRAERYTIFTGALLEALRHGIDNGAAGLSLHELYDEIRDLLRQREADDEGRPELHVPSQHDGDVSRLPLFPNIAHARALEARQAQEAACQEAARQEAARQEAARQEAARQEAARQEAARQEAAQAKARRQEAERHEAARIDGEMVGDIESAPGAASQVALAAASAASDVVPPPDAASRDPVVTVQVHRERILRALAEDITATTASAAPASEDIATTTASTVPASEQSSGAGRLTIAAFGGLALVTVVIMIIALSGKSQPAPDAAAAEPANPSAAAAEPATPDATGAGRAPALPGPTTSAPARVAIPLAELAVEPRGAQLTVDDQPVVLVDGKARLTLSPGDHEAVASAGGQIARQKFTVTGDRAARVALRVPAASPPAPSAGGLALAPAPAKKVKFICEDGVTLKVTDKEKPNDAPKFDNPISGSGVVVPLAQGFYESQFSLNGRSDFDTLYVSKDTTVICKLERIHADKGWLAMGRGPRYSSTDGVTGTLMIDGTSHVFPFDGLIFLDPGKHQVEFVPGAPAHECSGASGDDIDTTGNDYKCKGSIFAVASQGYHISVQLAPFMEMGTQRPAGSSYFLHVDR